MGTTVVMKDDSDGYTYEICEQSQMNTCAAASIFMIECMMKKKSCAGGEDRIRELAGRSNSTWAEGMDYDAIERILKGFGANLKLEESNYEKGYSISPRNGRMYEGHPALCIVFWYDKKKKVNGAHAIVCPWLTDDMSKAIFLDPWKGQLVELVNDGNFKSKSGTGKIGMIYYT